MSLADRPDGIHWTKLGVPGPGPLAAGPRCVNVANGQAAPAGRCSRG